MGDVINRGIVKTIGRLVTSISRDFVDVARARQLSIKKHK